MALIRQVLQHPETKKWAYIEYSDETNTLSQVLGDKEFDTEEEAIEWSKGFTFNSYEWKDPKAIEVEKIIVEMNQLTKKLYELENKLFGVLNIPYEN